MQKHSLWLLCEKAWSKLVIEHDKKNAMEHGSHSRHGRIMSLMLNSDETKKTFVLNGELQGVVIYFDARKYGHSKSDFVHDIKPDRIRAYLKKYAGVS